jgi:hypothetical protein
MFSTKNKLLKFQIFSVIFAWILGTILHFTYEWSNKNIVVAAFSAVNESTWEHLKLLFFPMFITTIIGLIYFRKKDKINNFLCAKTIGIIVALSFVVIFFYTYTGVIGTNFAILDIGSFFVGVFLGEYTAYKLIKKGVLCDNKLAMILIIIFSLFIIFTYKTPNLGIFKDPVNRSYGILL